MPTPLKLFHPVGGRGSALLGVSGLETQFALPRPFRFHTRRRNRRHVPTECSSRDGGSHGCLLARCGWISIWHVHSFCKVTEVVVLSFLRRRPDAFLLSPRACLMHLNHRSQPRYRCSTNPLNTLLASYSGHLIRESSYFHYLQARLRYNLKNKKQKK